MADSLANTSRVSRYVTGNKFQNKMKKKAAERKAVEYTVKPGDTLYDIARENNLYVGDLARFNDLEVGHSQ